MRSITLGINVHPVINIIDEACDIPLLTQNGLSIILKPMLITSGYQINFLFPKNKFIIWSK